MTDISLTKRNEAVKFRTLLNVTILSTQVSWGKSSSSVCMSVWVCVYVSSY
jgi:hypothetical protein